MLEWAQLGDARIVQGMVRGVDAPLSASRIQAGQASCTMDWPAHTASRREQEGKRMDRTWDVLLIGGASGKSELSGNSESVRQCERLEVTAIDPDAATKGPI